MPILKHVLGGQDFFDFFLFFFIFFSFFYELEFCLMFSAAILKLIFVKKNLNIFFIFFIFLFFFIFFILALNPKQKKIARVSPCLLVFFVVVKKWFCRQSPKISPSQSSNLHFQQFQWLLPQKVSPFQGTSLCMICHNFSSKCVMYGPD